MQALTGLGKRACDVAVKFAHTGILETGNKGVGRGKKKQGLDQTIAGELRTIVDEANKRGIPTSAGRMENELREKGIRVSARTITRYLRAEGYHWGKGTRQHAGHDTPGNVRYRQWYLQQRLENLMEIDGEIVPRHAEVFLDESYCHLNHTSTQRWVGSDGVTYN
jgi:transposase